jgi:hypothetical protein
MEWKENHNVNKENNKIQVLFKRKTVERDNQTEKEEQVAIERNEWMKKLKTEK